MSFSGPGLWYATRAAGIVTLLLLTATTALGLLTAGRAASYRWPRFLVIGLHRNVSLLALTFLGLHIGTTVLDSYTSISIQDAVIPFLSGYHRLWLGLGAIASDLLIAVSVTSALRQRIGHRLWRVVHWCGYLCWPVAMAHGMFPRYQDRLRPSSARYWYANDGVRKASQGNLVQRMFGKTTRNNAADALTDLLVPLRYMWIIDLSINTTSAPIVMGDLGSSWSYTVPYYGQKLSGDHIANETDARLYPYRRLIIASDNCVPYDGPAFDWHGMFPGVRFCTDDYPWEPLG